MVDRIVRSPQYMDLNKRQAQYLALQNQINPHFLYNTLESIRGEAIIAGLDSIADMTEALARFFRYTITKVENLVSVEEELDNCETYFGIQKYRFGDRLQLHIDYDIAEYEKDHELQNSQTDVAADSGKQHYSWRGAEGWRWKSLHPFSVYKESPAHPYFRRWGGMDELTLAKLNQKLGKSTKAFHDNEKNKRNRSGDVKTEPLIFGDEYGMHVYSVPGEGTDVEITIPILTDDRQVKNRSVLV